jgi:hypothetical protein
MSLAGRFRFARDFNLRTCSDVQIDLLNGLFIGKQSPVKQLANKLKADFLVDDPSLFAGCAIFATLIFESKLIVVRDGGP